VLPFSAAPAALLPWRDGAWTVIVRAIHVGLYHMRPRISKCSAEQNQVQ
jgi:hypothetical protein